jgi:putative membrane protein
MYNGGMGWGGGLFMLLVFVLVVIGAIAAIRYFFEPCGGRESALDILKQRYARGEITKAQFEEMKKKIE